MSALNDIGVVVGHFKDVYDGGEYGVNFSNVDPAATQKALLERYYFFEQELGYKKKYEMVDVGASSLKTQVDAIKALKRVDELNIMACKAKISDLEGELLAKDAEIIGKNVTLAAKDALLAAKDALLAAKDSELAAKDIEIAQLLKERMTNFLGSRSFGCAASVVSVQLLRYSLYDQLKNLGISFPFIPEDLGYAPSIKGFVVLLLVVWCSMSTKFRRAYRAISFYFPVLSFLILLISSYSSLRSSRCWRDD